VAPLPTDPKTPWPPPAWAAVTRQQALWSAWYSGSPDELSYAYQGLGGNSRSATSFFGGSGEYAVGAHFHAPTSTTTAVNDRYFWGTPVPASEKRAKLHVPIAGDIASMSADLLYAKKPRLEIPTDTGDKVAAAWLEARDDDDMHSTFLEAAEVCAALCGVYLRTVWDTQVSDQPWLDVVHPDAAIPTFRHGKLVSVVFWRILDDSGKQVVRHLEQHDMLANTIEHAVYVGDRDTLGNSTPLGQFPAMAGITETLIASNADGNVLTLPDLPDDADSVIYVPNMRPNRLWRWLPDAGPIGRSDYQGVEPLMDALDETYSSWMRDLRLAKSRLMVPPSYLESKGPGKPAIADIDREVFIPMNMLTGASDKALITANQFQIRFNEHKNTADALIQAIVHGAGYSPQTFGENSAGSGNLTATEIEDRQRRTILTRGKKTHYWRPAQSKAIYSLMAVERSVFKRRGLVPVRPDVIFPDAVLPSPQELAQTALLLSNAHAASTETLVQMVHPDWPADQVAEEVARIRSEDANDLLGRARVTLTPPMGSTETIGQQVEDIEATIPVNSVPAEGDRADSGATLAT
jgi:hypothetical protein